jgi:hypothetical protein
MLIYVTASALVDLDGFLTRESAEKLLVAPALTLALIPLAYAVAWCSKREQDRLWKRLRARAATST